MPTETKHPLATYRALFGLNQRDLAQAVGVSRWTIAAIEAGIRQPSIDLLKKLEARTGIAREKLRPDLYEVA